MFGGALAKAVRPYLEGDEQLTAVVLASLPGANAALMARGAGSNVVGSHFDTRAGQAQADAERQGIRLAQRMIVALTSRRLLVFRSSGAFRPGVAELITELPLAAIGSIEVAESKLSKTVTVRAHGLEFLLETARGQPAERLAIATAMTTVSA